MPAGAGGTFQYVPAFFCVLSAVFYMGYTFWGVYGLKGKSRCATLALSLLR